MRTLSNKHGNRKNELKSTNPAHRLAARQARAGRGRLLPGRPWLRLSSVPWPQPSLLPRFGSSRGPNAGRSRRAQHPAGRRNLVGASRCCSPLPLSSHSAPTLLPCSTKAAAAPRLASARRARTCAQRECEPMLAFVKTCAPSHAFGRSSQYWGFSSANL